MKKFISAAVSAALVLSLCAAMPAYTAAEEITVELDGKKIDFDVEPVITDGHTMVPLRKIFEELGALVKWNGDTQTVSARKSSKTVSLTINSPDLTIDKGDTDADGNSITETVTLEVPACITDDRTLVPARAVSEAFGLDVDWDEDNKKVVITSKDESDDSWKENTGTINLSDLTSTGKGVEISGKEILITEGGDFTVTGTLADGSIKISSKEKVKLRLKGASITATEGPCIFVEDADKAYITVSDGTENRLTAENSESGAIYSKDNLEIKGGGVLNVSSASGHAIKASDNLTVEDGTLNLAAAGDGIHINDTFKMTGGTVNITAVGDGIDSESIVNISGGKIAIETTGEPIETEPVQEEQSDMHRGMPFESADVEFEKSTKGINAEWMMCISGGDITINSASHAIHCADEIQISGGAFKLNSKYEKGISAHGNLTIDNSETSIDITNSTEGLESKNICTINDGTIKIVASDDGINATGGRSGEMPGMPGGNHGRPEDFGGERPNGQRPAEQNPTEQNPTGQNEPWRGEMPPEMNFGDGMVPPEMPNFDEMPDNFMQMPNPPQGGMHGESLSNCLVINGGSLEIFAKDDCLDSNGNLIINGGTIKAVKENGSFYGNNAVLDADGRIVIGDNVTLIAAGSQGSQGSIDISQNTIAFYGEAQHASGESITLKDGSGNVIAEYMPNGAYSAAFIISPKLEIGKTYTVSMGAEEKTVTLEIQNTTIGTMMGGRGDHGNRGDRPMGFKNKNLAVDKDGEA